MADRTDRQIIKNTCVISALEPESRKSLKSMNYYPKVKKFVEESFAKKGKFSDELRHFWRTAYWLKKLDPKADEAMLIAAVAHDIERAFPISRSKWQKNGKAYFLQRSFSAAHGRAGAFKVE